ncbi:MAG: SpoIID/LytB domain-containing protein [Candidatus Dojkabacteria bacterium]
MNIQVNKKTRIKSFVIGLLIVAFSCVMPLTTIRADELSEVNSEIQRKEEEKQKILDDIKRIESEITTITNETNDLYSKQKSLQAEKNKLFNQIEKLDKNITELEISLQKFESLLEDRKGSMEDDINYLQKMAFMEPGLLHEGEKFEDYIISSTRTNANVELSQSRIKSYQSQIAHIEQSRSDILDNKKTANESKTLVESKLAGIEEDISRKEREAALAQTNKSTLTAQSKDIESQLKFLSAKQQELLESELDNMNKNGQSSQTEIKDGEYYFTGRGRDLIEGHGLGMSQWGAYGMAQKGWSYDRILKYYYTGVTIGNYKEPKKIIVTGKTGEIPFDDYLAGIGEVPNSWPAEAIKAQVVAARTYVMGVCGNKQVCEICGTAACQVYVGGTAKAQYVTSTKGKVILHQGTPIVAYYSASHRGHSSTISSVWGGTDRPYIRSVNDDPYAYKDYKTPNPYNPSEFIKTYNWRWRTNGYDLAKLTDIFSRSSRTHVGNVKSISITHDVSGRVSRITIQGTGGSKTLTGWDFRAIFNSITPYRDYLYSTEFAFYQK